jgi:hypothetical protein
VPVHIQGAGQFRLGLQPVLGQQPGPFFRAVVETQGGQLVPQTTDLGDVDQDQSMAGRKKYSPGSSLSRLPLTAEKKATRLACAQAVDGLADR